MTGPVLSLDERNVLDMIQYQKTEKRNLPDGAIKSSSPMTLS